MSIDLFWESIISFKASRTPACPYDNAVAESFFRSLKEEEVYRKYYKEYDEMAQSIAEYVDFYNNKHPPQTLKYLTPNQVEEEYYSK